MVTALQNNSYSLSHFGHLVQDIQYLASCLSEIHYSHVRRHCNTIAHALARRANSVSHYQVWMEDVPPDINSVLEADFPDLADWNTKSCFSTKKKKIGWVGLVHICLKPNPISSPKLIFSIISNVGLKDFHHL